MPKHFTNFPEELEQYNPELLQVSDFENLETFNEQGQLHSHDDKPAHVVKARTDFENEFFWYKQGVVHRDGNKSPIIDTQTSIEDDEVNISYATYNDNYQQHSYDDMPSSVICYDHADDLTQVLAYDSFQLDWHKNGRRHRGDDKPAIVITRKGEITGFSYYEEGLLHRSNNLPARVGKYSSSWYVRSILHNTKGPATISHSDDSSQESSEWILFGIKIPESVFLSIISYQKEEEVPLWVAFLCVLEVITKDNVDTLRDESNCWNAKLPLEWQLRALGVNNETLKSRINNFAPDDSDSSFKIHADDTSLVSLKKLIQHEEENTYDA